MDNLIAPKLRLQLQPHEKIRVDMGYGPVWLASATDSWSDANRRDQTGQSGTFLGHGFDIRARCAVTPRIDVTLGYAHFIRGEFTRNTGRDDNTDFFYIDIRAPTQMRHDALHQIRLGNCFGLVAIGRR